MYQTSHGPRRVCPHPRRRAHGGAPQWSVSDLVEPYILVWGNPVINPLFLIHSMNVSKLPNIKLFLWTTDQKFFFYERHVHVKASCAVFFINATHDNNAREPHSVWARTTRSHLSTSHGPSGRGTQEKTSGGQHVVPVLHHRR